MTKKKIKEKRKSPRMQILADVTYEFGKMKHNAQMLNVSGGGAFLQTREVPELGEVIEIKSGFPGVSHTSAVRSKVVWRKEDGDSHGPAGVGIEFVEYDW